MHADSIGAGPVPGRIQHIHRSFQIGACIARPVRFRRCISRREHLFRKPVTERFENLKLAPCWRAVRRGEIGVFKITVGALVRAIGELLVRPFEIERVGERLSHIPVREHGTAGVEDKPLHALRSLMGEHFLHHAPVLHRRGCISGFPELGGVFKAVVVFACKKRLQRHVGVLIVIEPYFFEIEPPAVDGQILSPVIGIAHIFN